LCVVYSRRSRCVGFSKKFVIFFKKKKQTKDVDVVRLILESNQNVFDAFFSMPKCHFLLDDLFWTKKVDLKNFISDPGLFVWKREKRSAEFEGEVEALHLAQTTHENRLFRLAEVIFSQNSAKGCDFANMLVARNMDIEANALRCTDEV
jgi:hypothetical protein